MGWSCIIKFLIYEYWFIVIRTIANTTKKLNIKNPDNISHP